MKVYSVYAPVSEDTPDAWAAYGVAWASALDGHEDSILAADEDTAFFASRREAEDVAAALREGGIECYIHEYTAHSAEECADEDR